MNYYQNIFNFNNQIVLVVGGTGGLGSEIGKAFYYRGATVVLAGRDEECFDNIASQITELDSERFKFMYVNVTDYDTVDSLVDGIISNYGGIDVLVNVFGINILKSIEDYSMDEFSHVMDVNINSVHKVCKTVGKHMIDKKAGKIINVSSMKGKLAVEDNYSAYCASKAALNMYSKELACEWAKYNIRCNVIAPTFIETNINKDLLKDPEFKEAIESRIPMRRLGKRKDIANLSLFLASDQAEFITGQVIYLDGGLSARQ